MLPTEEEKRNRRLLTNLPARPIEQQVQGPGLPAFGAQPVVERGQVDTSYGLPSENVYQQAEQAYNRSALPQPAPILPRPAQGMQPVQPERTLLGTAADIGVTALKGAVALPQAFVGLADIPTGGRVGKGLEQIGYRPGEAQDILAGALSPAQQYAEEQVQSAKGFVPTLRAAIKHPSTIARAVGESAPMMLGGAGIARGILSKAPVLMGNIAPAFGMGAEALAGAIGEGAIGAGAMAESIREQSENRLLSPKQAASAVAAGIGTALFSAAGGRLAQKLGIGDIDTMLAGSSFKNPGQVAKAIVYGGVSEGFFEEMPQEMQETVWQNAAMGRPLLEGAAEAGAQALLAGATMGAGSNIYSGGDAVDDSAGGQKEPPLTVQPEGMEGEQAQQQAPQQPGADQDLFDQTRHFLDTGQISPDTEQGARIKEHLSEMVAMPEMADAVEANRDIFEAMGVVEPITVEEQLEQSAVDVAEPRIAEDAQEELAPGQAAQEGPEKLTEGRDETLTRGSEQVPGDDVALARAQALPEDTRTEEESRIVKQEEERVAADSLAIRRARAIPEDLRTDDEREVLQVEDERVKAEKAVSGGDLKQPWQQTRAEFAENEPDLAEKVIADRHENAVIDAVKKGEIIPDNVAKEYTETITSIKPEQSVSKTSPEADAIKGQQAGDSIDFTPESGTLNIPRDEMPQISSDQRGALANNLRSKGIEYQRTEKAPADLKPSQKEFLPEKVQAAREYEGTERAILVSEDGHVIDGHHQWMQKLEDSPSDPIPVIELGGNATEVIEAVKAFPSSTTAKEQAKTEKPGKELLEPITEKEDAPQLDTEKRTRYLGEKEGRVAATESKRRQIGEAKAFQEARRDPKKHTQLTTQRDYKNKLPRNTEHLMNVAADQQRSFNDAQASVDENKEHLEKLFEKAGTGQITISVGGQEFTVKKPKRGKEQRIMNAAGRDALDVLKQKYKDAGLLSFDYDKGGTLMIQPNVAGKSKAAAYGPKTLDAAAKEHIKFQRTLANARFKKDAVRKRIKETILSSLEQSGIDHVWANSGKDATFWVERKAAKREFATEEAKQTYQEERAATQAQPEHLKKTKRALGSAGVSEVKALGLKRGEKAERTAAAEAELDQILKSIAGTPLPKGQRADIMGELTKSLGRDVLAQQKRGVFEIVSPEKAAKNLQDYPSRPSLSKARSTRIESWLKKTIAKIIDSGDYDFYDFGLRAMTDPTQIAPSEAVEELSLETPKKYEVGDTIDFNSYVWDEEDPTDGEERSGVSAYEIDIDDLEKSIPQAVEELSRWWGDEQLILIAGERTGTGLDIGEVIIDAGEVVGVLDGGVTTEPKYSKEGQRLEGLTFPDGKVWLIDGNIEKGTASGVLGHELGVHARKLGFAEEKNFEVILNRVEVLKKTDKDVQAAFERVPSDTAPGKVNEEALAYLVSDAPQHGLVRRLWSALKRFLSQKTSWSWASIEKFTPADMQAMAQSAIRADTGTVARAAEGVNEFAQSVKMSTAKAADKIKGMANFKKWFGDSKVVGGNGEPKVIYHGTATEGISSFNHKLATDKMGRKMGLGLGKGKFYFSEYEMSATMAAEGAASRGDGKTQQVIAAYAKIEKPITQAEYDRRFQEISGGKRVSGTPYEGGYTMKKRDALIKKLDTAIRKEGFDGIMDDMTGQVAVFEPTQIKSIHNTGEWSPTDPDIMKSYAGERAQTANEILFKAWYAATEGGEGSKSYGKLWKTSGLSKKEFRDVVKELLDAGKVSLGEGGRSIKLPKPETDKTATPRRIIRPSVKSIYDIKNFLEPFYQEEVFSREDELDIISRDLREHGGIIDKDIFKKKYVIYDDAAEILYLLGVPEKKAADIFSLGGDKAAYDYIDSNYPVLKKDGKYRLVKNPKYDNESDGDVTVDLSRRKDFMGAANTIKGIAEHRNTTLGSNFRKNEIDAIYKDMKISGHEFHVNRILDKYHSDYDYGGGMTGLVYSLYGDNTPSEIKVNDNDLVDNNSAQKYIQSNEEVLLSKNGHLLVKKKGDVIGSIPEDIALANYGEGFFFSMSAPAQEARRNTENLNAIKDGVTSTTSAEAGNRAISSMMEVIRKVGKGVEQEAYKNLAKEKKFLNQYREAMTGDGLTVEKGTGLLADFARQSDVPPGTKSRISQLVKQITSAKRPETQKRRLNQALVSLEQDISRRLKTKVRNQIKRAAGPKREGAIKRGRFFHEYEADMQGIRAAVHMDAGQVERAIAATAAQIDRIETLSKDAGPAKQADLLRQAADAEVKLHHLKTFGNLAGKNLDELLQAKFQAEQIKKLGQSKLRAAKTAWQAEINKKTGWLAKEITGSDDPKPETVAEKARRKKKEKGIIGKVKGTYSAVENSIQSWEHLLDRIAIKSGKKIFRSRAVKEFGSMAHAGKRSLEEYNMETGKDVFNKGLEIFNVKKPKTVAGKVAEFIGLHEGLTKKLQKLSKKTEEIRVKGDTLQLSPLEAAYLYNVRKEAGSEPVFKKMGFTTESFSDLDALMTPELKAWADYLHGDLLAKALQGETEAYQDVNGVTRVPEGLFRDGQEEIPIMNLNAAVMNRVYDANHYRAWAVPSKTFNDVFTSPEIRGYIEQHAGTTTAQALDRFLEDFAKSPRELRGDQAWMDKLRSNVVMSMIGANPTTFFKQLTSIPAYAADIPVAAFAGNFAHGLANFRSVKKLIDSSVMAQERFGSGFDRDIHEASKATAEQVIGGKVTRVRDVLMSMTKLGDRAAIYAGYTVYKYHNDKAIAQGKTAKDAHDIGILEFEKATERTQQAAGVKDRGSFERGGSLQKLFTMYMTSPAAYTRQTMAAVRHLKTDPIGSSKRLLIFNVMLPMMFQAVASGFLGVGGDDEDKTEEFWKKELRAVALGPLMGVPIARDLAAGTWESMMGSWYGPDPGFSPVTEVSKSLTQAIFYASKGLREGDEKAIGKASKEFFDFLGYALGLPTKPGKRLWEGWADLASGETEHPVMSVIGMSRSARKEKHLGK